MTDINLTGSPGTPGVNGLRIASLIALLGAAAFVGAVEPAALAREVLQDGAGLEDRDRPPAGPIRIDDRRHPIVRRDRQKVRLELIAFGNVDGNDVIREPALLQHDGDLPAVGRGPIVEIDRFRRTSR